MGWLGLSILCTMVVLAITHFIHRKPFEEWHKHDEYAVDDYVANGMVSFFIALIFIGLIGGLYTAVKEGRDISAKGCYESVNRWDIVSAVGDKTTSASFILGTGGISTVDKYYVYRQEPQGLMLTTYYANKTYIVERDGAPAYERIDYVCPRPVSDFLWWSINNKRHNYGKEGTLYVPKDTILREFKL